MFRKIHSNRDPGATVTGEIRKEFSKYFKTAGTRLNEILELRPKMTFGAMVLLLVISLCVSLAEFGHRDTAKITNKAAKPPPVAGEASAIMQLAAKLKRTVALRNLVDSLSAKKHLDRRDSVILDSALDQLREINK